MIDLTGKVFGRFTVISKVSRGNGMSKTYWKCSCTCGNERIVWQYNLTGGTSTNCGCIRIERNKARARHNKTGSGTYICWKNMVKRCKDTSHKNYGGRGITVCQRWLDFCNFLADMGERTSPKHTIERVNNNKGYSRENCIWAIRKVQANNKRNNHNLTYLGETKSMAVWAEELGINYSTLRSRIAKGLPMYIAVRKGRVKV